LSDIQAWRKQERRRLIEMRKDIPSSEREKSTRSMAVFLDQLLPQVSGRSIGLFWPFLGEPDLRGWMSAATARGAICGLPVVTGRRQPLIFRSWRIGQDLERGMWNIPAPTYGERFIPDIIVVPVVGFDGGCFRLGYGGGFLNRTLADLRSSRFVIGVGFEAQMIESIHPLSNDIPLDAIITETAIRHRETTLNSIVRPNRT
jgi:5-formyltetrahydrofolate cyclo-ligase